MHYLFNTRPNYRICLGVNADFAFSEAEADARVGTKDPINQINPKYITINLGKQKNYIMMAGGMMKNQKEALKWLKFVFLI